MAHQKFSLEEIVFAKLRGWPAWPAKVEFFENIGSTNKVKYNIYFYGTNQIAQCKEEELFPYVKYRNQFGKPKKALGFMKAIAQADAELGLKLKDQGSTPNNNSNPFSLDYLKDELEVLKIDKSIRTSLNPNEPQLDRCLELLEDYFELTVTPLMFKKNPHLIETLLSLQVYTIENSADNQNNADDERKVHLIRKRSYNVYHKIQSVFTIPQGKSFLDMFAETLEDFEKHVKDMSKNELFKLTEDPTIRRWW